MERDFVVLDLRPGPARHIGLPRPISRRLDGQPPPEHDSKTNRNDAHCAPAALDEKQRSQHRQTVNKGERCAEPRDRQIEVNGTGRPGCGDEANQATQCDNGKAERFAHHETLPRFIAWRERPLRDRSFHSSIPG